MINNPECKIAIQAANAGAAELMNYFGKLQPQEIQWKGHRDVVTAADFAAEVKIKEVIQQNYPHHDILAEESGESSSPQSSYRWHIDPLDGTQNFSRSHPFFSVSIALEKDDEIIVGVVMAPILQQTFYAVKGEGAYQIQNGQESKLQTTKIDNLDKAILATGFAHQRLTSNAQEFEQAFIKLLNSCQGMRRCGSAALDLCHIASGCYDAFWEAGLHSYDVAAGSLIVHEAGGKVSDWKGGKDYLFGNQILASNGLIHKIVLDSLPNEIK